MTALQALIEEPPVAAVAPPLLSLAGLSIGFGGKTVVHGLDLDIHPGERVALVGESGSGKTVTALSILRLLSGARIGGAIRLQGEDLATASEARIRAIRGRDVAMIFQEPMTALNPLYTIGDQIGETLELHEGIGRREARARTLQIMERTGIREPARRIDSYPHQLSGGQRQRAMIAMALACRPKLLIADEPTTALDLTVRARIVQLLLDLQEASRADGQAMAVLLITHDLHLVRRFAQRVAVMERGRLVEQASTADLFNAPRHPYTIRLINSLPERRIVSVALEAPVLLETRALRVEYPISRPGWRGLFRAGRFTALAGANVSLRAGETIGVVGESGSGKSTLAQAILDLIRITSGGIIVEGSSFASRSRSAKRALRARLQVVFQDPFASLSPRRTVEQTVGEGLALHFPQLTAEERRARIVAVLAEVGLPESALGSFPHQFSGGQRQRIAIARAVVLEPRILVLDEPTSALDVSIQKQVLDLLVALQRKHGLSYILISHDLAVVRALAHRIYVLKDGEIVESGETEAVVASPVHPYTRSLIQAAL